MRKKSYPLKADIVGQSMTGCDDLVLDNIRGMERQLEGAAQGSVWESIDGGYLLEMLASILNAKVGGSQAC